MKKTFVLALILFFGAIAKAHVKVLVIVGSLFLSVATFASEGVGVVSLAAFEFLSQTMPRLVTL